MVPRFVALFCKGVLPQLEGLVAALESGDADGARRHAHAIKGSAGNIAALRMQSTASVVEQAAKEGDLTELPQRLAVLQQDYSEFVVVTTVLGLMTEAK
ncbi:MAG: Hpt domain-containing protein [Desulfuromonadaceae bacterium]